MLESEGTLDFHRYTQQRIRCLHFRRTKKPFSILKKPFFLDFEESEEAESYMLTQDWDLRDSS